MSLKTFAQSEGITAFSAVVRANVNGYPFVTALRGSDAENIYFSKNASAQISEGQSFKSIAKDLYVVKVENAAGEMRTKLSFNSTYEDLDSLFG